MTREERSWIMYDVANSAFVLIMVTAVMPVFFKSIAAAGMAQSASTAVWGYAVSAASLITALLSPFLGSYADFRGRKKKLFSLFLLSGTAATMLLALTGRGDWIYCTILFIIAKMSWASTNVFYDSFLTDVTSPERMDRVSSHGYAWGYIGSVVPFVAVIIILLHAGENPSVNSYRVSFLITAVWWIIFSVPMLRNVRQVHYIEPGSSPLRESIAKLASTLRNVRGHRNVFIFLAAYFLYIDGVDTIIEMAAAYGIDSGMGTTSLILAILMIQVLAFPFALLYGRLAEKYSARNLITAGIIVYMIITAAAFFLPDIKSAVSKNIMFWVISFMVATSMGGIQALSRSYFGKIIPAEKSAEFFGLYNIFGKFATIIGPFLMGIATTLTGSSRYGVLCIVFLFLAGLFMLRCTKEPSV
ncbi:MAG TPA: MFS transporter [Spirochaetota bacterium]|nr:MFS transporter [Spirochaetota bacterium]